MRKQAERTMAMLNAAERPLIVAGGSIINADASALPMDFEVSLAFDNVNTSPDGDAVRGYGVDHVAVAEGLGCKAIRVKSPNEFKDAFARAHALMEEHPVPVVLEFILEHVTNISMGTELDSVNEFEDILCLDPSLSIRKSQDMGALAPTGS